MIAGIVGKLGRGKTVLLTALAYINATSGSFFVKRLLFPEIFNMSNHKKVYANYHLKFPFEPVSDFEQINTMNEGSAFLDELWLWADSRMSMSKKNQAVSMIALTSRKRDIDIYYTAQNWSRIDKRIRNITDVILIPEINQATGVMKVEVCEPNEKFKQVIKTFRINMIPFFQMYDTKEEINSLNDSSLVGKSDKRKNTKEEIRDINNDSEPEKDKRKKHRNKNL